MRDQELNTLNTFAKSNTRTFLLTDSAKRLACVMEVLSWAELELRVLRLGLQENVYHASTNGF